MGPIRFVRVKLVLQGSNWFTRVQMVLQDGSVEFTRAQLILQGGSIEFTRVQLVLQGGSIGFARVQLVYMGPNCFTRRFNWFYKEIDFTNMIFYLQLVLQRLDCFTKIKLVLQGLGYLLN